jgi:hypothetical protein
VTKSARRLAYYRRRAAETTGATRRQYEADAERELAALHAADQCEDCGTPLEDPVSRSRHVGPSCWAKRLARAAA